MKHITVSLLLSLCCLVSAANLQLNLGYELPGAHRLESTDLDSHMGLSASAEILKPVDFIDLGAAMAVMFTRTANVLEEASARFSYVCPYGVCKLHAYDRLAPPVFQSRVVVHVGASIILPNQEYPLGSTKGGLYWAVGFEAGFWKHYTLTFLYRNHHNSGLLLGHDISIDQSNFALLLGARI